MIYDDTTIRSVSDFLIWVNKLHNIEILSDDSSTNLCFENVDVYYRGQSRLCWKLIPGIFREPIIDEHELLNTASIRLANEISSLRTYLDKIIYFQHYGLSTRLLDVTFNPLVALYMACCDESQYSCYGAVYCGYKSESSTSAIAESTAKYIFENQSQQQLNNLNKFAEDEKIKECCFREPIFIRPAINNPRIEAQNGAFIMAPLVSKKTELLRNTKGLDDSGFFDNKRAIIAGYNKEKLLRELAMLGIDRAFIYKGVVAKIETIMIEAKWNYKLINNINV